MSTIADLDRSRRLRNALDYQDALRIEDREARRRTCREVVRRHQDEQARLSGPSVGEVRAVQERMLVARTQPRDGDEAA